MKRFARIRWHNALWLEVIFALLAPLALARRVRVRRTGWIDR